MDLKISVCNVKNMRANMRRTFKKVTLACRDFLALVTPIVLGAVNLYDQTRNKYTKMVTVILLQ